MKGDILFFKKNPWKAIQELLNEKEINYQMAKNLYFEFELCIYGITCHMVF